MGSTYVVIYFVHEVVSVEHGPFGYPNQCAIVLILRMILQVFVSGEYYTILHPIVPLCLQ